MNRNDIARGGAHDSSEGGGVGRGSRACPDGDDVCVASGLCVAVGGGLLCDPEEVLPPVEGVVVCPPLPGGGGGGGGKVTCAKTLFAHSGGALKTTEKIAQRTSRVRIVLR
ncbi:MAG: hypothetical protein ABI551_04950, partial [Polyangiaceae bacterium]